MGAKQASKAAGWQDGFLAEEMGIAHGRNGSAS